MTESILGICILLFAGAALWRHRQVWQQAQSTESPEEEAAFAARQYRRRMQASGILAIIGAMMLASRLVTDPWVTMGYWAVVMLLVGWVLLLASADAIATKGHFGRLRSEVEAERAVLEQQLRELKKREGNGKA